MLAFTIYDLIITLKETKSFFRKEEQEKWYTSSYSIQHKCFLDCDFEHRVPRKADKKEVDGQEAPFLKTTVAPEEMITLCLGT